MKKNYLALLLVVALVMSLMCGTVVAFAETADAPTTTETEARLVYVKLADTWTSANVHAFNVGTGDSCFSGWPGKALVADEANAGWYYTFVSEDMDTVIINATVLGATDEDEDTAVQTVSLTIAGDSWITIDAEPIADGDSKGQYNGTVATEQGTTGTLPTYVATMDIKVFAPKTWESASLWAWIVGEDNSNIYAAWPGEEMTLGGDGWYVMENVPQTVTGLVVNNSVASEGMQTNNDVVIDTTKLGDAFIPTVYVHVYESETAGEHTGDVYYNEMPDVTPKYTVYAKIPSDWLMPCVWAWLDPAGTNMFAAWPGGEMEVNDDGWYTLKVSEWVNSIIINGNVAGETLQTVDLKGLEGTDIWIVVGEADADGKYQATVTYTEPVDANEPTDDKEPADTNKPVDTNKPTETDEPTGLSTGAVIAIVAGAAVVVAGVAVFVIRKKKAN